MEHPFNIKMVEIQNIPVNQYDGWRIYFVIDGEVNAEIVGEKYKLSYEDIVIINPFETHRLYSDKENLVMVMSIDKREFENLIKYNYQVRFDCNTVKNNIDKNDKKYKKVKSNLIDMMVKVINKSSDDFGIYGKFFELLSILSEEFSVNEALKIKQLDVVSDDEKINRIIEYIDTNYMNEISLEDVASREFLSYSYLSRYFKQQVGVSFIEYLTKIRLQNALDGLKHSDDSILKIAMKNGFSNNKSFYKQFRKYFGISPAEYRDRNKVKSVKILEESSELKVVEFTKEEVFNKLPKFMVSNDIKDPYGVSNRDITIDTFELPEDGEKAIRNSKIINIGSAENILSVECQDELVDINNNLDFDYIRMLGFCGELELKESSGNISAFNRNNRIFNYIEKCGYKPIIVIDQKNLHLEKIDEEIEYLRKTIVHFLRYFGEKILSKWYFEFSFSENIASYSSMKLIEFTRELKEKFYFENVGIDLGDIQDSDIYARDEKLLNTAYDMGINYSFIGVKGDFYNYFDEEGEWITSTFEDKYQSLKDIVEKVTTGEKNVFLTEWNTLVGDNGPLAGTFFRAALIVHTMDIFKNTVTAFGYWLNIEVKSMLSNISEDNCLSIFFYPKVKRPLYFTLMLIEKLRGSIVYYSDDTVVYKDREEYHIIQYNSCLLEPKMSISSQFIQYQTKTIDIKFKNLIGREYEIKSYLLDKDHGGIYNDWLRLGGETEINQEYLDYLETNIVPKYIMNYKPTTDSEMSVSSTLTMNAVKYTYLRPSIY